MKLANLDGRAVLLSSETAGADVHRASDGRFGPDLPSVYEEWDAFTGWAADADLPDDVVVERSALESPSPAPRQIVAIGLNYHDHASESGFASPAGLPPTFTKFVTSLSGPDTTVTLPPEGHTDWEVELVVVIGRRASFVAEAEAWSHVAGLAVGQDLSERISQLQGPAPQFSLGKSFAGFAPVGPWLVTPDEVDDPDDLALGCEIDGVTMQKGRTKDLIVPVARLVAELSTTLTLLPGDLIFTGTPAGVGLGRSPQRWLQPGEHLRTWVEGIGELHQDFVADGVRS